MHNINSRTGGHTKNGSINFHNHDTVEITEMDGVRWVEITSKDYAETLGIFVNSRNLEVIKKIATTLLTTAAIIEEEDK